MSDRYLCKAKRTNEEWAEGYPVKFGGVYWIYTGKINKLAPYTNGYGSTIYPPIRYMVAPSTLCQYTGLHDRTKWEELSEKEQQQFLSEWNYEKDRKNQKEDWNGKKIWENDIVKSKHGYIGIIRYGQYDVTHYGFYIEWINGDEALRTDLLYWLPQIRSIGNIFDNPELLEEGPES